MQGHREKTECIELCTNGENPGKSIEGQVEKHFNHQSSRRDGEGKLAKWGHFLCKTRQNNK